jgi:hypothetical protein
MNKNSICIFIVSLIIGTIGNAYGGSTDLEKLERDMQLDRIERKIDSSNIKAQNQQIKSNHNNSIVSVHPDYKKIAYGQEFPQWISVMSPKEIIRAKDIVYRGTADEINQLLTGYKGNYIPPILKRKRQVANSILGKKKNPARPSKNYNPMNFEGIENIFELAGNRVAHQVDQRKAIGMVNKKEILLLIDDYAKLNNEKKRVESTYIENTDQTTDKISNAYTVGQIVKLNNPSDDSVAFYKDSSLKDITILFTNGVRAKVIEVKGSNIYKVKVGEHIGWVSGSVIK